MGWLKNLLLGPEKVMPTSLTDYNFHDEVLQHRGPVLVDVWGPGCQPCEKLAPTIIDLATDYAGKIKICELNAAAAPKSAARMGVRGTPTIVAFRYGKEVGRTSGWKPKSYFDQMIQTLFAIDFQQMEQKAKREAADQTQTETGGKDSGASPEAAKAKGGKKKK